MRSAVVAVCALAAAGCTLPGPLWPKKAADFPASYRRIERVALFPTQVRMIIRDPTGETDLPEETLVSTAAEFGVLVEKGLKRHGLAVAAVGAADEPEAASADASVSDLIVRYFELSERIMPHERVLSAPERLIVKQRQGRTSDRPVQLGHGIGLGDAAVGFARDHGVDALMFVEFDAVYSTRAQYRSDTIWGAVLPNSTVDFAERYLPPDRFAIRLALIDGADGEAIWAFRDTRMKVPVSGAIAKVLGDMLDTLPPR